MPAKLTPGQQQYVNDLKASEATVAVTGRITKTEVIDPPEGDPRPLLVRATVQAPDGQSVYYDFYPPLSAPEELARVESEQKAERDRLAAEQTERERLMNAVEET